MKFKNREHAGILLAEKLASYSQYDPIILGLPRGGVPVASLIAKKLKAPLDVVLVKKIPAPGSSEFAIGAVAEDGVPILNEAYIEAEHLDRREIEDIVVRKITENKKRTNIYRQKMAALSLKEKAVIVVDDGLATGATMVAALKWLKSKKVERIIVAVPIASTQGAAEVRSLCDEFVSLVTSSNMWAVGIWYDDFSEVSDAEVMECLEQKTSEKKNQHPLSKLTSEIEDKAVSFNKTEDLKSIVREMARHKIVMLGEASHGTKEYYQWRREISKILIEEHGFNFIAVEGDWPDCYQLNDYVSSPQKNNAKEIIQKSFHRWPTWMWANEEIPPLIDWMKEKKTGAFYGLDVYSLFESIDVVKKYLDHLDPSIALNLANQYACFDNFRGNELKYAESLFKLPRGCSEEVVNGLRELLRIRMKESKFSKMQLFDIRQNARIIKNAESYYRTMLTGGADSWNVRDHHMMETLDQLLHFYGPESKGIVWAHNTHIGDYHATDMQNEGYINLGGLARERYGMENVFLMGFGSYAGEVTAAKAWGSSMVTMTLPEAKVDSYENYFHQVATQLKVNQFYLPLNGLGSESPLHQKLGHRAVGVVYDPLHEKHGFTNYVPTKLADRYDCFMFIDQTHALVPIASTFVYGEFPETWPAGQ